ncbi:MAG: radical SAM protein [Oscillospiraceae bacterium]
MTDTNNGKTVLLVAFYNIKALGARYLEAALRRAGYRVVTVFYKDFNSLHPQQTTETELELLASVIARERPFLIGFSVMSSMYLDTVNRVIERARSCSAAKTVCGGAYATMFPERFLDAGVDFVLRTDGEITLRQLADALSRGGDWRGIPSLCYRGAAGNVMNEIGNLLADIDGYGLPSVECENALFIEHGTLKRGDPQLDILSYEVIASRGCPFTCSYCCCVNLRRLFPKDVKFVRTRSVASVIEELTVAKRKLKKLVFVHFYDEIFPNLPGWVDEFVVEYKKHINLPFTIWSHPKMIDAQVLRKLVSVGLTEVIMGIQSGSERVRRDVFHRYETQEDIINATRVIREAGVSWASYDFMLQHPFETLEDLKETYFLAQRLSRPFELQLHGLNFLPGTDIVGMAIAQGKLTREQMDKVMYAPMQEQFGAYWKRENELMSRLWYRMTYCLQFPGASRTVQRFEQDPAAHEEEINACYEHCQRLFKRRYYIKKFSVVMKRVTMTRPPLKRAAM